MDHRLGFYVFGISRARRMGIDRVLIHTNFFDILPPPLMTSEIYLEILRYIEISSMGMF